MGELGMANSAWTQTKLRVLKSSLSGPSLSVDIVCPPLLAEEVNLFLKILRFFTWVRVPCKDMLILKNFFDASSYVWRALERRLSSCGPWAQLLHCMWDLPRPGLEPVSPALTGRFLTTEPPGKPRTILF